MTESARIKTIVEEIKRQIAYREKIKPNVTDYASFTLSRLLRFIDNTKFKIGDRVRIMDSNAKGDVITNIYINENDEMMFSFEHSDDCSLNDRTFEYAPAE